MRSSRYCFAFGSLMLALAACAPEKDGVSPANPRIDARFPIVVTNEATVELLGSGFGQEGTVSVGATPARVLSWSDERIFIEAPHTATNACTSVTVTAENGEDDSIPLGYGESGLWVPEHTLSPLRIDPQAVWTGRELIGAGFRYDPKYDTWTPVTAPFPSLGVPESELGGRELFWTGTKVLDWRGGAGAMFDPETDTWELLSAEGAPRYVPGQVSAWGGGSFFVYGGPETCLQEACSLRPTTAVFVDGKWNRVLTQPPEDFRREQASITWTGSEFLVWGGYRFDGNEMKIVDGGIGFNPQTRSWRKISINPPKAGFISERTIAISNNRLLVEGSIMFSSVDRGLWVLDLTSGRWRQIDDGTYVRYDSRILIVDNTVVVVNGREEMGILLAASVRNSYSHFMGLAIYSLNEGMWESPSTPEAITERTHATVFADGAGVYVLGGGRRGSGRFDLSKKEWTVFGSPENEPWLRSEGYTAWTGSELLIYGGGSRYGTFRDGARYNPTTDTWTPIIENRTLGYGAAAIWTGSQLFVWGGSEYGGKSWNSYGSDVSTGALYDPGTNAWKSMPSLGAPSPRTGAAIVATGNDVIVWGGVHTYTTVTTGMTSTTREGLHDGASFHLATGTWSNLPLSGAPDPLNLYWAVWSGKELFVLGVDNGQSAGVNLPAAAFNPSTRQWRPIAALPAGRSYGLAYWLAGRVVVGPNADASWMAYSPDDDAWQEIPVGDSMPVFADSIVVPAGDKLFAFPRWWAAGSNNQGVVIDPLKGTAEPLPAPCGFFSALGEYGHFVWTGDRILGWGDGGVSWFIP